MSRSVIRYRTTVLTDDNIFRPLVVMLNDFLKPGAPYPIPEIIYQSLMSETTCLPGEKFYPHAIIIYMLKRRVEFMKNLLLEPHFAKRLSCLYYDDDGRLRMHEFSNTMPLHADIVTLNFLYLFFRKHEFFPPQMYELATMMLFKYLIYVRYNENEEDPTSITLRKVHLTFQSVTLWMYNYIPEFAAHVRFVSGCDLPAMLGAPFFPLILCKEIGIDIALCLYIVNRALRLVFVSYEKWEIMQHARECADSIDVYTPYIRFDICIKLGIAAINQDGTYAFTPNFERAISTLRSIQSAIEPGGRRDFYLYFY